MGKIIITGASSEIGQAIVDTLSELDKPMILHCNKNISSLLGWQSKAEIVQADFSIESELNEFMSHLSDTEIIINAAAYTRTGLLPEITDDAIAKMVSTNIIALTKICRSVIPCMCAKRNGIIINISSVTASRPYRGQTVYAGTKAYIESFSKAIAAEFGKKGVRCNCVAPGSIVSGALKPLLNIAMEEVKSANAVGQLGTPRDVAEAVRFLCSETSKYINGTVIHVDGGYWTGL